MAKGKRFGIRMSLRERTSLGILARRYGMSMGEYVRQLLRREFKEKALPYDGDQLEKGEK